MISIIINGVRYDAVETKTQFDCDVCDLHDHCTKLDNLTFGKFTEICAFELDNMHHTGYANDITMRKIVTTLDEFIEFTNKITELEKLAKGFKI